MLKDEQGHLTGVIMGFNTTDLVADQAKVQEKFLKDYSPSPYQVDHINLDIQLHPTATRVTSEYEVVAIGNNSEPLVLDGEELTLLTLEVNGARWPEDHIQFSKNKLVIFNLPEKARIKTVVEINPTANSLLSGLYITGGDFCTQCESHGFRRITYFLDRPDVLATYRVTLSAPEAQCPVLLSNGNVVEETSLPNGFHQVVWHDPHPKPSYLFALIAGRYEHVENTFITGQGKSVQCRIYVREGQLDRASFALDALTRAMRWDEEHYNRYYDLEVFNIVAVNDFNFGAMENKGLNIFNDKYILADPAVATDHDRILVDAIIAHEYFHNWSGNRVTLRDWFQLSLKEGLTVLREHEYTADITDKSVQRIQEASIIRSAQFTQDAGPMAHPVRPDRYLSMNNFYTVTVYNKGAEVIRMLKTMMGERAYYYAVSQYFDRYDGQAATVEDFLSVIAEISGLNLQQFKYWYTQAGTPTVSVSQHYDPKTASYQLALSQSTPATLAQPDKEPFHIPLKLGLLDQDGAPMEVTLYGSNQALSEHVLHLTEDHQVFTFQNVSSQPVLSFLRDFSAPVKIDYQRQSKELKTLWMHDVDPFARWDAAQTYMMTVWALINNQSIHQLARYE